MVKYQLWLLALLVLPIVSAVEIVDLNKTYTIKYNTYNIPIVNIGNVSSGGGGGTTNNYYNVTGGSYNITYELYSYNQTLGTSLSDLLNPRADKQFDMANKVLNFSWTTPTTAEGAIQFEARGGYSGDLVHIHQHSGNPSTSELLHIEATDPDVKGINITTIGAGIHINGKLVDMWLYNQSNATFPVYGKWWYNQSNATFPVYGKWWYNHTSTANTSIVTNYGKWWYNQTLGTSFANVAYLNNSQMFLGNQTIRNSSLIVGDISNSSKTQLYVTTNNFVGIRTNSSKGCTDCSFVVGDDPVYNQVANFRLSGTTYAKFSMVGESGNTDEKKIQIYNNGAGLYFGLLNDAENYEQYALYFTRSGTTPTNAVFGSNVEAPTFSSSSNVGISTGFYACTGMNSAYYDSDGDGYSDTWGYVCSGYTYVQTAGGIVYSNA